MSKAGKSIKKMESSKAKNKIQALKDQQKEYPRSYRFDSEIMTTLQNTLAEINHISPKKISESRLVKALILLSREIDKDKILKAIKQVW